MRCQNVDGKMSISEKVDKSKRRQLETSTDTSFDRKFSTNRMLTQRSTAYLCQIGQDQEKIYPSNVETKNVEI